MSGSLNKVTLIGNVGKDPEIRAMQNGRSVANFSVATTESWKDKMTGEKREKTEWHNVVVFAEGLVRVCQNYVKKGTKLYIEGQLQTRKWQDQEGKDRYTTEIVLQNYNSTLILLDSRNGGMNDNSRSDGFGFNTQNTLGQDSAYAAAGTAALGAGQGDSQPVPSFATELDDDIPF
ncbi:MAG: single-stranded DNA-binding protein [Pseudomonadota bacterium]